MLEKEWDKDKDYDSEISPSKWNDMVDYIKSVIEPERVLDAEQLFSNSRCASIVIHKLDDGTIVADGPNGEVDRGADASSVIQSSINESSKGGKILIAEGEYTISSSIEITDSITGLVIEGESTGFKENDNKGGTILTLDDNVDDDMFRLTTDPGYHSYFNMFKNICLMGNKDNNAKTSHGINIQGFFTDFYMQNVIIYEFNDHGINLENSISVWNYWIKDSLIEYCGGDGIHRDSDANIQSFRVSSSHIVLNDGSGIYWQDEYGGNYSMTALSVGGGTRLRKNNDWGLALLGARYVNVENSNIVRNHIYGFLIQQSINTEKQTENVRIHNNFIGNHNEGAQTYGIKIKHKSDYIDVKDNVFEKNTEKPIYNDHNPNGVMKNNRGFKTENSGQTSASDGDTISHGLDITPNIENINVGTNSSNRVYVTSTSSDNFTIALEDTDGSSVTTDDTIYWNIDVY